ncbi:AT-rich interactive domain-containing protein 5B isoform X1 [Arapaima gigas]
MEPNSPQWVGSPCGLHGPYVFYKAFRFHLEGKPRILSLGDFFFVRCKPEDPICIAELQLLWEERTTKQLLSSSKLYFLPEDTPQGRTVNHGEDEVIAVSEKVIVKLEDLTKWMVSDSSVWTHGLKAVPLKPAVLRELGKNGQREALHKYRESTLNSGLNFKDVLKEKAELGEDSDERRVLVLSYPQYCRYRSVIARLRERPSSLLTDHVVLALGGVASLGSDTRILYCRDTFEHSTLIENESICDEFAPNLKGRPRKKKPSISQRRDSQSQSTGKETISPEAKSSAKVKSESKAAPARPKGNGSCKKASAEEKPSAGAGEECREDEQAFLVALYKYMKERKTPIERIPYLGFKQINLWTMFQAAQKLGGYEQITARRQWKNVYDELGGNPGSTSAATCTRRHYERLILPYERYTRGEEDKPLPPAKPRKQEASNQEGAIKTKVATAKRPKDEQNQKSRTEKDISVKGPEPSLVPDDEMKSQVVADIKLEKGSTGEEEEQVELEELQLPVKEEPMSGNSQEKPVLRAPPWDNGMLDQVTQDKPSSPQTTAKCEELQDKLSLELLQEGTTPKPLPLSYVSYQNGMPESSTLSSVGTGDSSVVREPHTHVGMVLPTLKHKPSQTFSVSEIIPEKEKLSSKDESCIGYTSMVYPRVNSGIMSPLAKKKLLSQVSGTSLPNSYSFGQPPPLINTKCTSSGADDLTPLQSQLGSIAETVVVSRPSVIQHAQSFRARHTEERKPLGDVVAHDPCRKSDTQMNPTEDPYLLRTEPRDNMEKTAEKRVLHPTQLASYMGDFYPSAHLHNLYRQTEHHRSKEQMSKFLGREPLFADYENIQGVPPSSSSENVGLSYCTHLSQKERLSPLERLSEDQPTDLSLPKSSPNDVASSKGSLCGPSHSIITPVLQGANNQTSNVDYQPRACRVPPMTMIPPKKGVDHPSRSDGSTPNDHSEDIVGYKMEEMVRPILGAKSSPQNIGAARPLKRNLEELENVPSEKKIRAVTPMHAAKDSAGKVTTPDLECEATKPAEPAHTLHVNSYTEGHKFQLPSPIFPGLYHGAFVSQVQEMCDGLSSCLPAGYSHPLQYLKNQAVVSPLVPPFTIHSIMMQRQLLASTASPTSLYRHPIGSSYGDLFHHSLYPVSALNAQPAFSPPQLPSVHPSTKLS